MMKTLQSYHSVHHSSQRQQDLAIQLIFLLPQLGRWDAEFTVGISVTNRRGNFVADNSWPMNGITFSPNLTEDFGSNDI